MRKLMALLAIVCASLTLTTKSWALFGLENVTYDGSLEISGNSANNETDLGNDPSSTATSNDHRGRTATRLRVGMNADVTEKVTGRLEIVRTPRQYGEAPTSVSTEESKLVFHNAFIDIADIFGEGHSIRIGRQYVGNPGDLIWNISPTDDDNLTANSIDGLLFRCRKYDFLQLDIFTGKAAEDDTITGATTDTDARTSSTTSTGDVNLTSIDIVFPKLIPAASINLGYLFGKDSNATIDGDNNSLKTGRVGINGNVWDGMITYRGEFFQNMGEFQGAGLNGSGAATKLKYEGNAIDLGVGLNTKETSVGSFGVWANFLMASGDDNVTDDKDESFHDFSPLGVNTSDRLLGEIFGKSNVLGGGTPLGQGINTADSTGAAPNSGTQGQGLQVINVGAHMKPWFSKKSTFRADYFMFSRGEDSVKTAANTTTKVGDDFGNELDLSALYDHTENVNFEVGYAMLMPDDALLHQRGFAITGSKDDTITKLYARAKVKWGGAAK